MIRTKIKKVINNKFKSNSDPKKKTRIKINKYQKFSSTKHVFNFNIYKKVRSSLKTTEKKINQSVNFDFFYFFLSFILYTDDNKKNFEIAFYQIEKNEIEKSILFLFRFLNDIKIKY